MENPYFISPVDEYERLAEHLGTQQNRTIKKKKVFLEKYREYKANVSRACKASGITRKTFYNWRDADEYFRGVLETVAFYYDPGEHIPTVWERIRQGDNRLLRRYMSQNLPDYKYKRPRDNQHVYSQARNKRGRFIKVCNSYGCVSCDLLRYG